MGIVVQSGLARGSGRAATMAGWPDDAIAPPARTGGLPALEHWSTPRLRSLVAGRIRSGVRSRLRGPVRALKRARRAIAGARSAARSGRGRPRSRRGGRAGGPPIHSTSMQTTRREAIDVEATKPE
jgi:hypothetical protein